MYYKTIKTSLSRVLKLRSKYDNITDAVSRVDQIVIRAWMFLRLYLLHTNCNIKIDENLVDCIFKVITIKVDKRGKQPNKKNQEILCRLQRFYHQYFQPLLSDDLPELISTHLSTPLDYAARQMVTGLENNIKTQYVEYVESYVNAHWEKQFLVDKIRRVYKTKKSRDTAIYKLTTMLRKIKNDMLNVSDNFTSSEHYWDWIRKHKKIVLPSKDVYERDSLFYDLQCNPQDYLLGMLEISRYRESRGLKLKNFCPLRTSIIPKHIRLDTTSIIHLLWDFDDKKRKNKSYYLVDGKLKANQDYIWETFFRTDKKFFRWKNYSFDHQIETDGVSVSIILKKTEYIHKRIPKQKRQVVREPYLDDLESTELTKLRDLNLVGIDPNMGDLLYCRDESGNSFRYTQDQRRQEIRDKRYKTILNNEKNHEYVDGKTITEWENLISKHDHKSVDITNFSDYIRIKLEVITKIRDFYLSKIWRKLKLSRYWNVKRSEFWMMARFEKIFGPPRDTVIGIGDWEQKRHRKFKEPTKGKGFRNVFRKHGYKVYLVDEFRTSCQCSHCQSDGAKCEKFRVRRDPNSKKSDEDRHSRLVHGLLRCKICDRLWNRDANSAINILKITKMIISHGDRPEYLKPAKRDSGVTSTLTK